VVPLARDVVPARGMGLSSSSGLRATSITRTCRPARAPGRVPGRRGAAGLGCSFPGRLSKPRRSGNAERIGTGAGADAHESDLAASEGAYELGLTEE
jgi:hypothetical protein